MLCAAAWAHGGRSAELLIVTQVVCGTAEAFFSPSAGRLLVALSTQDRLIHDNALLSFAGYAGEMAGPASASVLLAVGGPAAAIGFDALTVLVSAQLLAEVRMPSPPVPTAPSLPPHRATRSVISNPAVRALLAVEAGWALLGTAPILVLGPVVCVNRLDGPASWAAIVTAYGAGGVLGAIVMRSSAAVRRHAALGFLLEAPAPLLLAVAAPTWLVAVAAMLGGSGSAGASAVITATLQLRTPPRLQATTAALQTTVELALLSAGYLVAGALASAVGTPAALTMSAVTGTALAAVTKRFT
jgi:hypothetical protein